MSLGRTYTIGKNTKLPAVGFGTWQSKPGETKVAVLTALKVGYTHLDLAWIYGNEKEVGEAIAESGIKREKLFLTSKLWNSFHSPDQVEKTLDDTLAKLGTTYLDMYLMHWPVAFKTNPSKANKYKPEINWDLTNNVYPTWKEMERMVSIGKIKHIGVSNFTIGRIKSLLAQATIKPVCNQVELNLNCAQPELIAWCKTNNILCEAYSPLGSTGAPQLEDEVIIDIAKAHKCEPANVLISFQVQRGVVCLPKSVTPSRITSNFQDVVLTAAEMERLEKRAASIPFKRSVDPSKAWGVDIYNERPESKL